MRKINTDNFYDYVIKGRGWSWTITNFKQAVKEFQGLEVAAQLLGNRKDGVQVIIDQK